MTAPASPTECEGCHWDLCPQGGERPHQCLRHNAKDARIRELAAQVQETPTECEACGQDSDFQRRQAIKICDVESENRQLKFDLESAQSISERKDARIRELVGDVEERDRQMAWALKSSKTKDVLRRQMAENKRAALARSEGGT